MAVLFLSKSISKSFIRSTLLALSTSNIEFTEGMLDRWDCRPVIGLIIGSISSDDLFINGITTVSNPPPEISAVLSLVASFSGTTRRKPSSEIALNPLTCIVLR